MNQLAILRRHLCILRQIQPPFLYPSKQKLLNRLEKKGLETAPRTFERNKKEIEDYYGLRITYCPQHKGYFLHQPEDEDLSDFNQFLRLLERSERLAFLTNSADALSTGKYLLLEENQAFLSLQHLPVLWEALRMQRRLTFKYKAFGADKPKEYLVDPLVLLEYRNRWYLAAWDPKEERFKTFGLERMTMPALSKQLIQKDRRSQFLALKEDALGVYVSPEDEVEQVVLKVQEQMVPYIRTVPIHHSQKILKEEADMLLIELRVITNPELEREILSYGEQLEVVEPLHLRKKIRERAEKLMKKYSEIISAS